MLRTDKEEHKIERSAQQWWQRGLLPDTSQHSIDRNDASYGSRPILPEGTRELVFYGASVWPHAEEEISFPDACTTYALVDELHGMLKVNLGSDKKSLAIKLRHYGKWVRRLHRPAADMMFRMASAIDRKPDNEFQAQPPPLEVSYEG